MSYFKNRISLWAGWLFCMLAFAGCKPAAYRNPPVGHDPSAARGHTIFFDDFSGPVLDTTKWNVERTGMHVNTELQAYVDSAATISLVNGSLIIQPAYSPG